MVTKKTNINTINYAAISSIEDMAAIYEKIKILANVKNEQIFKFILKRDISGGVRMKSIINKDERTPSLFIYYDSNYDDYMFKDFSSGAFGDAILFTSLYLFDGSLSKACDYIKENIEHIRKIEIKGNIIIKTTKTIIHDLENINRNSKDDYNKIYHNLINRKEEYYYYFTQNIGISYNIICKHNVSYDFVYLNDNKSIVYYYINERGKIVQRYNPYTDRQNGRFKTIVRNMIPYGIGYVNERTENIVICSGVKDLLSFETIINSKNAKNIIHLPENMNNKNTIAITLLSEKPVNINTDILRFVNNISNIKNIFILYDNDETGLKMAQKTIESNRYHLKEINIIPMNNICHPYKDISDWLSFNKSKIIMN